MKRNKIYKASKTILVSGMEESQKQSITRAFSSLNSKVINNNSTRYTKCLKNHQKR